MWGDPYDSSNEEWVAHLTQPPLHPLDGNVEQPTNVDEDLGMVQLVNDVFVVTNHVATRTTREANVGVVVETNILLEHVDQVLQDGGNLIERDRGHGVVRNLHGNQVVGPTSNIKTHLPSIHGDTSKNGGNNINFLPNRMDLISNSVGVGGVGIEPKPLGARHATDHILTTATENIPKYSNPQNGGATLGQPQSSTYENNMLNGRTWKNPTIRRLHFNRPIIYIIDFELL
jgi:hypothetical protein